MFFFSLVDVFKCFHLFCVCCDAALFVKLIHLAVLIVVLSRNKKNLRDHILDARIVFVRTVIIDFG